MRIITDTLDSHLLYNTLSTHATITWSFLLQPACVTTACLLHDLGYHRWYYTFIMTVMASATTHRDGPCKSYSATEKIRGSINKAFVHGVDNYDFELLRAWKVSHTFQDDYFAKEENRSANTGFSEFENNCFDSTCIDCALQECSTDSMSYFSMGTWLVDGDAEDLQKAIKDLSA
ncbi:hypothetical protein COCSADRAFT_276687 [Bipolaris sorokiniana ND90Pr]|uniref:Uncharacterized protein n=1 Tax=Cochliobolus sativus (strain ND90Pr / ATCC 201652) TaxID=665912 RepID=M2T2T8_COCSN|nr:uncharacterized protein COCSADRAFT_276687 [Bipolaris sorokiniana ND90Pr]EMD68785.1 hypothetical protein COCSADRAFT_276687 [Bipolaris sorokiniana ND90Pr]